MVIKCTGCVIHCGPVAHHLQLGHILSRRDDLSYGIFPHKE